MRLPRRPNVMYDYLGGKLSICRSVFDEKRSTTYRRGKHGRIGIYWSDHPEQETLDASANIEYHVGGKSTYVLGGGVGVRLDEHPVTVAAYLWPCSLYVSVESTRTKALARRLFGGHYGAHRTVQFVVGGWRRWAISWQLWTDPHEWSTQTPRWRDGTIDLVEALIGRRRAHVTTLSTHAVAIPMPERTYPATVELKEHVSWPARLPFWKRTSRFAHIDIPGGIGFPGKGENAYDIDDDAIFALSRSAETVEDAIGATVAAVMRNRMKYGGSYEFTSMEVGT